MTSALSAARANELVARFADASVLIVGDVMLDHFVVGRVSRISPEAPVPVVEYDHDEYGIGGAGNVANNVRALAGAVELVGLIGEDRDADVLRDELLARHIGCDGLVGDKTRRTTTKQRIVTTRNQHVARVDYENDAEAGPAIEQALMARVDQHLEHARVVVVSDYLKGVVTRGLMSRLVELARMRNVPVLVDPKIPHIDYYAGATLVTPNHNEAEVATHMRIRSDEDARRAGYVFMERAHCLSVLITRGEQGMSLVDPSGDLHFPAVAREVADVTGAGDTVIAALALSLAAGATRGEAAQLANHAAAIVVGHFGAATVTPAELLGSF
ncbi:MAG: D-glycero-beta-D-manno-heptose-7-phosphate kinase [Acidobacteria bacterium]|nr:D-glycero-beta-D-manno-heptose-7-phosphate kinase [Acidobacteriota bacterium]